jgi:hypothetical protein
MSTTPDPVLAVPDGEYWLTGAFGSIQWRGFAGHPVALFHGRYPDGDTPCDCNYVDHPCYANVGLLRGKCEEAFRSGDKSRIEVEMRGQYAQWERLLVTDESARWQEERARREAGHADNPTPFS